jgi:hypothetical protein
LKTLVAVPFYPPPILQLEIQKSSAYTMMREVDEKIFQKLRHHHHPTDVATAQREANKKTRAVRIQTMKDEESSGSTIAPPV